MLFQEEEGKRHDSSDILSFHHLVSHDGDDCSKQAPELMMQALVAVFLLR